MIAIIATLATLATITIIVASKKTGENVALKSPNWQEKNSYIVH